MKSAVTKRNGKAGHHHHVRVSRVMRRETMCGKSREERRSVLVEGDKGEMCTYGGCGGGMKKKKEEEERRDDGTRRRGMIRSRSCARTRYGEPGSMCGEKTTVTIRGSPVMSARSARSAGNAYTRQVLISARVVPSATNGDDGQGRPKLTKESEPQEYWKSKAEREGKTPWQDPLVISLLVSFVLIFVILGVAIGTGYVG